MRTTRRSGAGGRDARAALLAGPNHGRRAVRAVGELGRGLIDLIWPQTCTITGQWLPGERPALAPGLLDELGALARAPYCPRCGRTAAEATVFARERRRADCGQCRDERHWTLAEIVRGGAYEPLLRQLLLRVKFGGDRAAAGLVMGTLAEALRQRAWLAHVEMLVPVPMHWRRRWQRPANHARLLADELAGLIGKPVRPVVRSTRYHPSQAHNQSRTARFENVRGAFAVGRPKQVAGRVVCVVDNLITTGATVHEMAKVLRAAGAKAVYAAVAARAGRTAPGSSGSAVEAAASADAP